MQLSEILFLITQLLSLAQQVSVNMQGEIKIESLGEQHRKLLQHAKQLLEQTT